MPEVGHYTIGKIAEIVKGEAFLFNEETIIRKLAIDSRIVADTDQTLFFAVKAQRNGHHFIATAYQNGMRNFMISDDMDISQFPHANWIKVPNVVAALQQLATYHRSLYALPVIGITGSNGKTI